MGKLSILLLMGLVFQTADFALAFLGSSGGQPDCICKDLVTSSGFGNCIGKKFSPLRNQQICYVVQPTSCPDVHDSNGNPGEKLSAHACELKKRVQLAIAENKEMNDGPGGERQKGESCGYYGRGIVADYDGACAGWLKCQSSGNPDTAGTCVRRQESAEYRYPYVKQTSKSGCCTGPHQFHEQCNCKADVAFCKEACIHDKNCKGYVAHGDKFCQIATTSSCPTSNVMFSDGCEKFQKGNRGKLVASASCGSGYGGCFIKQPDVCTLKKETAQCRALLPRYYYDQVSNKCLSFDYGGCDGNMNRFETSQECEDTCKGKSRLSIDKMQGGQPLTPGLRPKYEENGHSFWGCVDAISPNDKSQFREFPSYNTAIEACADDSKCSYVYDEGCDDNGPFRICPVLSLIQHSRSDCLYRKIYNP